MNDLPPSLCDPRLNDSQQLFDVVFKPLENIPSTHQDSRLPADGTLTTVDARFRRLRFC